MLYLRETLSLGLALFSMFFGSGNLIFPLVVGVHSTQAPLLGALALALSAVALPFLGVSLTWIYQGNLTPFFDRLLAYEEFLTPRHLSSKKKEKQAPKRWLQGSFLVPLLLLSLMGPFAVIPRCLLVAYAPFEGQIPLLFFSFLMVLAIYGLIHSQETIVPLLGNILSPALLVALLVIALPPLLQSATFAAPLPSPNLDTPPLHNTLPTKNSFEILQFALTQGYFTMDLFAAYFFSSFTYSHLKKLPISPQRKSAIFGYASILGALLLFGLYLLLVLAAAHDAASLEHLGAQQLLSELAANNLPKIAHTIVSIAIVLACITTAMVLAQLFASFIHEKLFLQTFSLQYAIYFTLALSIAISTLGFATISLYLGAILSLLYPLLIAATLLEVLCWSFSYPHNPHLLSWLLFFFVGIFNLAF